MRYIEIRVCKQCGNVYRREGGGKVPPPAVDFGMCLLCQARTWVAAMREVFGLFGGNKNGVEKRRRNEK